MINNNERYATVYLHLTCRVFCNCTGRILAEVRYKYDSIYQKSVALDNYSNC